MDTILIDNLSLHQLSKLIVLNCVTMNFKSDWTNSTQTYQEHMKGKERTTHVECSGNIEK